MSVFSTGGDHTVQVLQYKSSQLGRCPLQQLRVANFHPDRAPRAGEFPTLDVLAPRNPLHCLHRGQRPYPFHCQGGAEFASACDYFLSLLSVNDLGVSFSTLPTVLTAFCFHLRKISFDSCMAQMFFIHFFSLMESGVLLVMSFDRYVAICNPLRYTIMLRVSVLYAWACG